jgi:hypothetical protein
VTTQKGTTQPQRPCGPGNLLTREDADGWLLPQPCSPGTSQRCCSKCKCECEQQFTEWMLLFCDCWWDVGRWPGTVHPSQMLNAISGDRNITSPEKTQLLTAWCWKIQAKFQKPSKLMSNWQSAKNLSGIKFPLFIFPLQVISLWK